MYSLFRKTVLIPGILAGLTALVLWGGTKEIVIEREADFNNDDIPDKVVSTQSPFFTREENKKNIIDLYLSGNNQQYLKQLEVYNGKNTVAMLKTLDSNEDGNQDLYYVLYNPSLDKSMKGTPHDHYLHISNGDGTFMTLPPIKGSSSTEPYSYAHFQVNELVPERMVK